MNARQYSRVRSGRVHLSTRNTAAHRHAHLVALGELGLALLALLLLLALLPLHILDERRRIGHVPRVRVRGLDVLSLDVLELLGDRLDRCRGAGIVTRSVVAKAVVEIGLERLELLFVGALLLFLLL